MICDLSFILNPSTECLSNFKKKETEFKLTICFKGRCVRLKVTTTGRKESAPDASRPFWGQCVCPVIGRAAPALITITITHLNARKPSQLRDM